MIVIVIIGILMSLLFPVFAKARGKARSIVCISNLRQLGMAAALYRQDYDERWSLTDYTVPSPAGAGLLAGIYWWDLIGKTKGVAGCPEIPNSSAQGVGYLYNLLLEARHESAVTDPTLTITFVDHQRQIGFGGDCDALFQPPHGCTRHNGGANYLLADGHVKWYQPGGVTYKRITNPPPDKPRWNLE